MCIFVHSPRRTFRQSQTYTNFIGKCLGNLPNPTQFTTICTRTNSRAAPFSPNLVGKLCPTLRVGPSPNGLPASRFRDKWQIWDGKRNAFFSPSQIVTFLPVQKSFVLAVPKSDVFREGCDQKRHKLKKIFSCARASHSSQKCDKCDASHFLSQKKVTNVTSLTQIWDGKLWRNPFRTDPYSPLKTMQF